MVGNDQIQHRTMNGVGSRVSRCHCHCQWMERQHNSLLWRRPPPTCLWYDSSIYKNVLFWLWTKQLPFSSHFHSFTLWVLVVPSRSLLRRCCLLKICFTMPFRMLPQIQYMNQNKKKTWDAIYKMKWMCQQNLAEARIPINQQSQMWHHFDDDCVRGPDTKYNIFDVVH